MKRYNLVLLTFLLMALSAKAEDVYVVVSATITVYEGEDKFTKRDIYTDYSYVSPVIKINKERYHKIYAEQAFGEQLVKRYKFHTVRQRPLSMSFADRKEARKYYDEQKKAGYARLSFTRTSIEKKWREVQERIKKNK